MEEISILIHAFIESFLSHTFLEKQIFLTVIKASKGQSKNQTQNEESDGIVKDFSLASGVDPVALADINKSVGDNTNWQEAVEKINKEIVANTEWNVQTCTEAVSSKMPLTTRMPGIIKKV